MTLFPHTDPVVRREGHVLPCAWPWGGCRMRRFRLTTLMAVVALAAMAMALRLERRRGEARVAREQAERAQERIALWRALMPSPERGSWSPPGSSPFRLVYEGAPPVVARRPGARRDDAEAHRANEMRCRLQAAAAREEEAAAAARAVYFDELARKYGRAALEPWLPVPPDPPVPR
jgi:hypothetical protein